MLGDLPIKVVMSMIEGEENMNIKRRMSNGKFSLLHTAYMEGLERVKEILQMGNDIDVNRADNRGDTILHVACAKGDVNMVKIILEYARDTIDVNRTNFMHNTPLHMACAISNVEIVKLLLERDDVDINVVNLIGGTPIHLACKEDNIDIAKLLMIYPHMRLNINVTDKEDITPLIIACSFDQIALVNMILYYPYMKVSINKPNKDGLTPLHTACARGNAKIVKALIDYPHEKLNFNAVNENDITALIVASQEGHSEIVKLLLATGEVEVNRKSKSGITALHMAAYKKNEEIVKMLLATGELNVNEAAQYGITPLHIACENSNKNIVEMLLEASADMNMVNREGYTALHLACEGGDSDIIMLLLKRPLTKMNLFSKADETPLHIACREKEGQMIRLLLARTDVDVNANRKGYTPLCQACDYGYIKVVERLLERDDVDITIIPNKTGNITKLVRGEHGTKIVEMLKERALKELPEECEKGDAARVSKLINIVKNIPSDYLIKLVNLSNSEVIQVFINKFGVVKLGEILLEVDEGPRNSMIEAMSGIRDVIKKVRGDALALIESKIIEKIERAIAIGDEVYVRHASGTGIDMAKIKKENKIRVKRTNSLDGEVSSKDLFTAVKLEDIKWLRKFLKKVSNLEIKDEHGKNVLMMAVERKNISIVKLILERGIDIEARDNRGKSSLMIAVENNCMDVVNMLLSEGANVNAKDNNNRTVLMYALRCGESMSRIIDNMLNEDACVKDLSGATILMHACVGGYMKAIEKALELGVDINASDVNGRTAVGIAYSKNNLELTRYLMKRGAVSPGNMSKDKKNKFRELLHKISVEDRLGMGEIESEQKNIVEIDKVDTNSKRNKRRSKGKSRGN